MVHWIWLLVFAVTSQESNGAVKQYPIKRISNDPLVYSLETPTVPKPPINDRFPNVNHLKRSKRQNHVQETATVPRQRRCHANERYLQFARNSPSVLDDSSSIERQETTKRDVNATYGGHSHHPTISTIFGAPKKDYNALQQYLNLMHQVQRDTYNNLQSKLRDTISKTAQPWREEHVPKPLVFPETDSLWQNGNHEPAIQNTHNSYDPPALEIPQHTHESKLFNQMQHINLNNQHFLENEPIATPDLETNEPAHREHLQLIPEPVPENYPNAEHSHPENHVESPIIQTAIVPNEAKENQQPIIEDSIPEIPSNNHQIENSVPLLEIPENERNSPPAVFSQEELEPEERETNLHRHLKNHAESPVIQTAIVPNEAQESQKPMIEDSIPEIPSYNHQVENSVPLLKSPENDQNSPPAVFPHEELEPEKRAKKLHGHLKNHVESPIIHTVIVPNEVQESQQPMIEDSIPEIPSYNHQIQNSVPLLKSPQNEQNSPPAVSPQEELEPEKRVKKLHRHSKNLAEKMKTLNDKKNDLDELVASILNIERKKAERQQVPQKDLQKIMASIDKLTNTHQKLDGMSESRLEVAEQPAKHSTETPLTTLNDSLSQIHDEGVEIKETEPNKPNKPLENEHTGPINAGLVHQPSDQKIEQFRTEPNHQIGSQPAEHVKTEPILQFDTQPLDQITLRPIQLAKPLHSQNIQPKSNNPMENHQTLTKFEPEPLQTKILNSPPIILHKRLHPKRKQSKHHIKVPHSTTEPYQIILLKEDANKFDPYNAIKKPNQLSKKFEKEKHTEERYKVVVETAETESPEEKMIRILTSSAEPGLSAEIRKDVNELKEFLDQGKLTTSTTTPHPSIAEHLKKISKPKTEDHIAIPFDENKEKVVFIDPNETHDKQIQFVKRPITRNPLDAPVFSFEKDDFAKSAPDTESSEDESQEYKEEIEKVIKTAYPEEFPWDLHYPQKPITENATETQANHSVVQAPSVTQVPFKTKNNLDELHRKATATYEKLLKERESRLKHLRESFKNPKYLQNSPNQLLNENHPPTHYLEQSTIPQYAENYQYNPTALQENHNPIQPLNVASNEQETVPEKRSCNCGNHEDSSSEEYLGKSSKTGCKCQHSKPSPALKNQLSDQIAEQRKRFDKSQPKKETKRKPLTLDCSSDESSSDDVESAKPSCGCSGNSESQEIPKSHPVMPNQLLKAKNSKHACACGKNHIDDDCDHSNVLRSPRSQPEPNKYEILNSMLLWLKRFGNKN